MAKTKQEITDIISERLYISHYNALTFSDLSSVVGGLSAAGKAALLEAILGGQDAKVGQFLRKEMIAFARANADVEATSLMADDVLTLAELQIIYP